MRTIYSQSNGGTPSIWVGAGAEAVGLAGQAVERETMTCLLQGLHPDDGRALVDKAGT
ncbi:relaxase domain-containing protein [Acidithiobacillus ferriphilus]|nr:relaxase domain-containing protein [Acidithiobacillus ferriphilus]